MFNPVHKPAQVFAMRLGALREARLLLRKKVTTTAMSSGSPGATQPHGFLSLLRVMKYSAMAIAGTGVSLAALISTPLGLQGLLTVINTQIPGKIGAAGAGLSLDLAQGTAGLWMHDFSVTEPASMGGQTLLEGADVTWQAKPLQMLSGNVGSVTISGATLNGGYSASGRDFRIIRYMEAAGLLESPPPKGDPLAGDHNDNSNCVSKHQHQHHNHDDHNASVDKGDAVLTSSKTSISGGGGLNGDQVVGKTESSSSLARGCRKTGPGEQGPQAEVEQEQQQEGSVTLDMMNKDRGTARQHQHGQKQRQDKHSSSSLAGSATDSGDTGMATQGSDTEAAASEAAAQQGGEFMRVLCTTNSSIDITAELRQPGLCVQLKNSRMRVSEDMRDILGGAVHVAGAFGHGNLTWLHEVHLKSLPHALFTGSAATEADGVHDSETRHTRVPASESAAGGVPDDVQNASSGSMTIQPSTSREVGSVDVQNSGTDKDSDSSASGYNVWWKGRPTSQEPATKLQVVMDERGTKCCTPGEWRVVSPTLQMTARVWEVSAPGLDMLGYPTRSFTLLHQPAAMSLAFTPALGRFGLAAVNPLLGRVSSLREGSAGRMQAVLLPDGWLLPYTSASMYVEPMCLQLGASPLLSELVTGLRVLGFGSGVSSLVRKAVKKSAQSAASSVLPQTTSSDDDQQQQDAANASRPHNGSEQSGRAQNAHHTSSATGQQLLEAWLSGMHIRIERDGVIQQRRVDMLLGPAGMQQDVQEGSDKAAKEAVRSALHVALWGQADPDTDEIDFVVGLPSELLQRMGIKSLPDSYCLPIRLIGTMDNPKLELQGLSSRLKQMLLRHAAQHAKHTKQQQQQDEQHLRQSDTPSDTADQPENYDQQNTHVQDHGQPSTDSHDAAAAGIPGVPKLKKAVKAVKWVWDLSLRLLAPSQSSLEAIEKEIQEDTARVPVQHCPVPWDIAADSHT